MCIICFCVSVVPMEARSGSQVDPLALELQVGGWEMPPMVVGGGCKDGLAVKNKHSSSRGPRFCS